MLRGRVRYHSDTETCKLKCCLNVANLTKKTNLLVCFLRRSGAIPIRKPCRDLACVAECTRKRKFRAIVDDRFNVHSTSPGGSTITISICNKPITRGRIEKKNKAFPLCVSRYIGSSRARLTHQCMHSYVYRSTIERNSYLVTPSRSRRSTL